MGPGSRCRPRRPATPGHPCARFSRTGKPGKQLPMMTLPVVLAPPSFSRTFCAEDASALDGPFADVRRLDRGHEQVELHDRGARVDDLVETAGHRFARDGRRDALDAGRDERLDGLELRVGVTTLGSRDLQLDVEVVGRGVRAVDDLLDERVAQHVGHEPELDRLRDRGPGRGHRGGRLADRCHARRCRRWGRGRATARATGCEQQHEGRKQCEPGSVLSSSVPPPQMAARSAVSLHGPCSVHRSDQMPPLMPRRAALTRGRPRRAPVALADDGPAGPPRPR